MEKEPIRKIKITVERLASYNNGKNFSLDKTRVDPHEVFEFDDMFSCNSKDEYLHLFASKKGHHQVVWTENQLREKLYLK